MKYLRKILLLSICLNYQLFANTLPDTLSQSGWIMGAQAWTFREFTTFEAIAKIKEAGGNIIEIFPGQTLKPGSDVKTHHSMQEENILELLAECEKQGVTIVNYGVVTPASVQEIDQVMSFAKRLGLYAVTTETAHLIDAWEKAAIQHDIRVGFHQHGGSMSKPEYKVWHPLYISGLIEGRDPRVGACADLGHWRTSNLNSVECLRILKGRIISVHLKDKAHDGDAPVINVGTGVVNVAACLEELRAQDFKGHFSVEHENDWKDNVANVKAAFDFLKKHPK